ncbi:MAG: HEAT repeat domain-containing protein [Acidobacteria bacterium]|nr:HEAT repeat domain-containing protein [Acidobacteriota bacterium]
MWIDLIFLGSVGVAILAWAGLSLYMLAVQSRREATRAALQATLDVLLPLQSAALPARLAAARPLLQGASRELLMHGAAERDLPQPTFETLMAVIAERWSIDVLVRDASAHTSGRDKWRRTTALTLLARHGHPHAMTLVARALNDRDQDVAASALAVLGRAQSPEAADLLVGALTSSNVPASRVALYIDQSPLDLAARLTALLGDADPLVRQSAATLLARYPEDRVEDAVTPLVRDADPRVRKAAIQTLGRIGTDRSVPYATGLLSDPVPFVRAHAVRALGELGRADLADRVAGLLGDGDWWVRLAARESLEMMGSEVWPVLVRCLDHRDRFVRNGAAEVAQNLGVLDSLIMLEAASDNPTRAKVAMLQRIAAAGGVRFTESLVERAGPVVGPRVRRLLDTMGLEHVGAA